MIRTSFLAALALLAAVAAGNAQTSFVLPDTEHLGSIERAIVRLEVNRSGFINHHDTLALRRIYADDFHGIAAGGLIVDRPRLMQVFTRDDTSDVFTIDQIAIRVLGRSGDAVLYQARLTTRRKSGEQVAQSLFMHVYVLRDGRWQIIGAQGTPVAGS